MDIETDKLDVFNIVGSIANKRREIEDKIVCEMMKFDRHSATVYMNMLLKSEKCKMNGKPEISDFHITTKSMLVTRSDVDNFIDYLENNLEAIIRERLNLVEGSGISLVGVEKMEIFVGRREVGTLGQYVDYPAGCPGERLVVNVKTDFNCLLTSLKRGKKW